MGLDGATSCRVLLLYCFYNGWTWAMEVVQELQTILVVDSDHCLILKRNCFQKQRNYCVRVSAPCPQIKEIQRTDFLEISTLRDSVFGCLYFAD